MTFLNDSGSSYDDFGYYSGPETFGIPTKFGFFGDPGMEFGTLAERVAASYGTTDGDGNVLAPSGWTRDYGWGDSYGFRVEPQRIRVFDENEVETGWIDRAAQAIEIKNGLTQDAFAKFGDSHRFTPNISKFGGSSEFCQRPHCGPATALSESLSEAT